MKRTAVVLFSGGIDSTVCLECAARDCSRIVPVTFDYGQSNWPELRAAKKIVAHYGMEKEHIIQKLRLPECVLSSTPNLSGKGKRTRLTCYVPFRNSLFAAYGVAICQAIGATDLYVGIIGGSFLPDAQPEWAAAVQELVRESTLKDASVVSIIAPLQGIDKAGVVRMAARMGVPLSMTWSCFYPKKRAGKPVECGTCNACKDKKKALDRLLAGE